MKKSKKRVWNQQSALDNNGTRTSIANMVLQRMRTNTLHQVDENVANIPTVRHVSQERPFPENWPVCPTTCDKMEWRRALENKEYYEIRQIEDDGKKKWFHYPRYPYQYSEFVYCTPDMAKALFEHMPINRNLIPSWVEAITRDIINERWLQTHESIAINKNGDMHDGQHRGQGIINAGKGWPIYFTWNVPAEALYVTDSGQRRKINEKLALLFPESKLNCKSAALCRSMMQGLSCRGLRYSESEIAEFAVKYGEVIKWVSFNLKGFRADLQAVVGKALLWWGESTVTAFVERLRTVTFTGDGDPAKALYLWMVKAKQDGRRASYANPVVYYKKALSAINSHIENKDINKLSQRQTDIFEWLPGWTVPAEAPSGGNVLIPVEAPVS